MADETEEQRRVREEQERQEGQTANPQEDTDNQ